MTAKDDVAVLGVGLVASLFGNFALAAGASQEKTRNQKLKASLDELRKWLVNWQAAYQALETQLVEATQVNAALGKANEGLTSQLTDTRQALERTRTDLLNAEKRYVDERESHAVTRDKLRLLEAKVASQPKPAPAAARKSAKKSAKKQRASKRKMPGDPKETAR